MGIQSLRSNAQIVCQLAGVIASKEMSHRHKHHHFERYALSLTKLLTKGNEEPGEGLGYHRIILLGVNITSIFIEDNS